MASIIAMLYQDQDVDMYYSLQTAGGEQNMALSVPSSFPASPICHAPPHHRHQHLAGPRGFGDPRVQALRDGLESGHYRAIGTHAMRSELAVVLARPQFGLSDVQQQAALQQWEALTEKVDMAPPCNLSCRDPDDRKFLDLAVAHRVDWLLSKDRALLAARKFALKRFDLHIVRWSRCWQRKRGASMKASPSQKPRSSQKACLSHKPWA